MKKVLITGNKGMLGTDLVITFREAGYDVIPCDIEEFDITDSDDVSHYVTARQPDLIIHPAAWTDVDGCESDPDKAYRINALGAKNIAMACKQLDIPMVYYSTDYIFNGENKQGYRESDPANPINVYGWSKYEGEKFIQGILKKYYILRISWLYGRNGKNFVDTILKLAREKDELTVVDDQKGSPTYTKDVAAATVQLCQRPDYGIYHITNSGSCTWYQFAKDICGLAGLKVKIIPVTSEEYKRSAKRPKYSMLENSHWQAQGYPERRHYKEALKEFIEGNTRQGVT
jgi:dTDP-4-dehydrorhamnose reductase